jgi:hypothetical protein
VPEEVLGLRAGTTDATAVSRIGTFHQKINTFQKKLARAYNMAVVDRILDPTGENQKVRGSVKLVFNPASQPTEDEIITMMQKLAALDPLGNGQAVLHLTFDRLGWDWEQFVGYLDEESVDVPEEKPVEVPVEEPGKA